MIFLWRVFVRLPTKATHTYKAKCVGLRRSRRCYASTKNCMHDCTRLIRLRNCIGLMFCGRFVFTLWFFISLGKTIQVIAYVSAMFDMQLIKNVLLVIPLSVIPNWIAEFKNWAPGIRVECFHGNASKRKAASGAGQLRFFRILLDNYGS